MLSYRVSTRDSVDTKRGINKKLTQEFEKRSSRPLLGLSTGFHLWTLAVLRREWVMQQLSLCRSTSTGAGCLRTTERLWRDRRIRAQSRPLRWKSLPRVRAESQEAETKPPPFKAEDLRTFQIPEGKTGEVVLMALGFLFRAGSGSFTDGYSVNFASADDARPGTILGPIKLIEKSKTGSYKRPEKPIELYEYEACPFCRKVREAVTALDLEVMYYPTPSGSSNHRAKVKELGGKAMFPFMVDPNTGKSMYESDDIIAYLFKEYGEETVPLSLRFGAITTLTAGLVSLLRFGRGSRYRKAKYPEQPLVLWGNEMSPFTRFVRETLVELELPFKMIYCGRGSINRQRMRDAVNAFQIPFLEDPNTGVRMFESTDIVKYLEQTYAL